MEDLEVFQLLSAFALNAQIPIEQHSHLRWWCAKARKLSLAWNTFDCNQSLQPQWSQMKSYIRM